MKIARLIAIGKFVSEEQKGSTEQENASIAMELVRVHLPPLTRWHHVSKDEMSHPPLRFMQLVGRPLEPVAADECTLVKLDKFDKQHKHADHHGA